MSFSGRYIPAVLLACLSVTVSLFAQTTTKQTSKVPRGTVSGRVTIKDKGAAGVTVGIRKTEDYSRLEPMQRAITDHDGFYRITNVAAGSFDVIPSAPGFVAADPKDGWNKIVIVGEDENVEDINFALVRGGVITGRVTDSDGHPVIEQQVNIYPIEAFEQQSRQREVHSAGAAQTDDRGIYRMYGVNGGRYKVAVGKADDVYSSPTAPTRVAYQQVFHPDVTDQAKAAIVEVTEGSEANNVDITVGRPLQTYSVSGRVVDAEKGLPVPNIRFGLQRTAGRRTEFVNLPTTSNGSGEFFVEGLLPGTYSVFMYPNQNGEMRAETLSFDVVDQDVSNVTVRLTKGASLTGVVVIENQDKAAPQNFSQFQLRANAIGSGGIGNSATSPISPDGSFRLAGLPGGTINIQFGAKVGPFPPRGLSITRIERDGAAVAPRGIDIKDGEQVTGLRVVVAYGNGTIRGVVKFENGSQPAGTGIFVRVTKVGEHVGMRPPRVDARGQFLMEGLPAGVYEVLASLVGGGVNGGAQPRIPSVRREVTVQDGVVTDVVITFDLGATSQP